jgi:tetratricopeptide (TPR) repeat protein
MFGKSQVTVEWLFWLLGGCALGLFGRLRSEPNRVQGTARLAPALLAAVLLLDAGTALAADTSFGQGLDEEERSVRAALPLLERATRLRPYEPAYFHELGGIQYQVATDTNDPGLLRAAVASLTRTSRLLSHKDPYVLLDLANATTELEVRSGQQLGAGLALLQQAILLDPMNPLLYASAAEIALRENRPDQARAYWQTARGYATTSESLLRVGQVAEQLGDLTTARAILKAAASKEWQRPFQADLYRAWGDAAARAGVPDEAATAYGQVLEREPDDLPVRVRYAEALAASGKRDEALAQAREVLESSPGNARAAALIAQLGG